TRPSRSLNWAWRYLTRACVMVRRTVSFPITLFIAWWTPSGCGDSRLRVEVPPDPIGDAGGGSQQQGDVVRHRQPLHAPARPLDEVVGVVADCQADRHALTSAPGDDGLGGGSDLGVLGFAHVA